MTGRRNILVHAAPLVIFVGVLLSPATAWLQEQTAPAQPREAQAAPEAPAAATPEPSRGEISVPPPAAGGQAAEAAGTYTINRGDTLWDIANALFKDPFLWPLIWKSNPSITNPDLIYPGNSLAIPSLAPVERAMSAPQEAAPATEEKALTEAPEAEAPAPAVETPFAPVAAEPAVTGPEEEPKRGMMIMPEEGPLPLIDKYTMISAGFVNAMESADEIAGAADGKGIVGYDDIVYISVRSRPDVSIGDRFLIYEPLHLVKHPVTKERFGRLIKILGVLKVTEKGEKEMYTARITLSFDAAGPGSLLTAYAEPALLYSGGEKKAKDISAVILEVTDRRTINAQTDIVYIDKGQADGVEPGDRFTVYARPEEGMAAPKQLGEVQVFLVKERTATGLVRKSVDTLARGDRMVYKK